MKICSWNVYFYNTNPDEVLEFVKNNDFDIWCLQEVSEDLLDQLKRLSHDLVFTTDHTRVDGEFSEDCYLVILTKHKIINSHSFMVSESWQQPFRTKAFVKLMKRFNWVEKILNHHAIYADTKLTGQNETVRVFSTHLRHNGSSERIKELSVISGFFSEEHSNILCGDFNTVYNSWLNMFNYIMGSPVQEAMPWNSETKIMERFFKDLNLKNPLKGKTTHSFFKGQLDHILVPEKWKVKEADVIQELSGSDHYPIFTDIGILN
jgi:endonuclease/exonuclease/phosphatase family metal-dependent hydrolase